MSASESAPVTSASPTGFPSPADDYEEKPLDLHDYVVDQPESTFFMRAGEQVMAGAEVNHGDLLVVDRSQDVGKGDLMVAAVAGDLIIGRMHTRNSRPSIDSLPPGEEITVWGKVTFLIRQL